MFQTTIYQFCLYFCRMYMSSSKCVPTSVSLTSGTFRGHNICPTTPYTKGPFDTFQFQQLYWLVAVRLLVSRSNPHPLPPHNPALSPVLFTSLQSSTRVFRLTKNIICANEGFSLPLMISTSCTTSYGVYCWF